MIRTAIYLRVSTERQSQEGDSIEAQRDALHKYIDSHDNMIFYGEYLDDGISGTKSDRDELQRMLKDAKDGKIDQILVTKLDRLYRNIRHYLNMQEQLDKYHVNWLAIWEPIYDTSTPQGRLIINQMMSIAQFEAENTGQRIRQVQAYKVSKGEVISGSTPVGFTIINKRLVPNENADTVRQVFEYYSATGNLSKTMGAFQHTNIFPKSKPAFKRMLMNEKYIGVSRDNMNFCTPIIDRTLFNDVQRKLKINIKMSQKRTYLFSGLLVCSECGAKMGSLNKKRRKIMQKAFYRCPKHYATQVKTCTNTKVVNESVLERYLLTNINTLLSEYVFSAEAEQAPYKDDSARIAYLNKKLSKLKELYINDLMTLDEYKADKISIQAELDEISKKSRIENIDFTSYHRIIDQDITQIYDTMTKEERRTFWRSIIKEIRFGPDREYRIIFL